jgi:Tfp pilus assembly protein PilN
VSVIYLAVSIVLVIIALVVRDQTEFKLSRLRADLLALRSEEQRLGMERSELERMVAQTAEAIMRADNRQRAVDKQFKELVEILRQLDVELPPSSVPQVPSPSIPQPPPLPKKPPH